MPLSQKVCLVTGGTRGIGRAIAETLARQGATLALAYRGNDAAARDTACNLEGSGARCALMRTDIANPENAAALPGQVVERFGRLDVLVNNAGCTFDGAFAAMASDDFMPVVDVNLLGTVRLSLAAAPHLIASGGAMVMVSSLAAVAGKEGQVPYATTKGGINGLTRMLARRLGARGVRVNAVAPGFIRTEMVAELPANAYSHILDATALKRMGEPREVAEVVAFLAGPRASYVNGAVLRIDGGFHR